jgi:Ran GTPase-activating protein (RanGAP) involved in mRNA processing and transport
MKKTILAMTFAATALLASCGNKTSEESEAEVTPVEEIAPEVQEVEEIEVEVDTASVEVVETPSN